MSDINLGLNLSQNNINHDSITSIKMTYNNSSKNINIAKKIVSIIKYNYNLIFHLSLFS